LSFFIAYHFLSTKAVNEIEPFKYRLRGEDQVIIHDQIHCGTVILLEDERFTFAYFDYDRNFERFHAQAEKTIAEIRAGDGELKDRRDNDNLIHHSALPWFSFTSISHARDLRRKDSIPKISFGKYFKDAERIKMPISVEVHHALMDGLHVGRYFELLENYFAEPRQALGL
jgi:chloramphenicol O-acetyltransferase type A